MKNTPKLQDTLEVLFSKIDSLESKLSEADRMFSEAGKIPEIMDVKLNKLKETNPKVDPALLIEWGKQILPELDKRATKINSVSEEIQFKLDEVASERKRTNNKPYVYVGVAVLISLLFVSLYTRASINLKEVETEYNQLEQHNISMFKFINDKEQTEELTQWLNQK